jgi:hypothetical protein
VKGIIDTAVIPTNLRQWGWVFGGLNRRFQVESETGPAVVKNSRAEDQRFHRATATLNRRSAQTSSPLTASDAGSDATIAVAAHVVRAGSLEISYDAGSITGLAYSTKYFVYADDPNLDGGAVTYAAATNYVNAITGDDRYYVGEVTTPAAAGPPNNGGGGGGGGNGGLPWP